MNAERLEELAKAMLERHLPADCPERLGDRVGGCTHDDAVRKARNELGIEGCSDLDFTRQETYSCSRSPGLWEHLADEAQELCREDARSACEYFGFVNAKGEVVVPKRGAGAALVEAVERFCFPDDWLGKNEDDERWGCPWCGQPSEDGDGYDIQHEAECPVAMGRAALRALQGGDDGCPRDA